MHIASRGHTNTLIDRNNAIALCATQSHNDRIHCTIEYIVAAGHSGSYMYIVKGDMCLICWSYLFDPCVAILIVPCWHSLCQPCHSSARHKSQTRQSLAACPGASCRAVSILTNHIVDSTGLSFVVTKLIFQRKHLFEFLRWMLHYNNAL